MPPNWTLTPPLFSHSASSDPPSSFATQAAAGFAVSMFALLYISRVLQNSYLVWPLVGLVAAFVLAAVERPRFDSKA